MNILTIGTLLLSTLFISACVTWQKPGVSEEDAKTALAKCRYNVGLAEINTSNRKMVKYCMMSQGYR